MRNVITASVIFVVQDRTDDDDENRMHRSPSKPLEVMDSDGFRQCFVNTLEEAEDSVRESMEDMLGLSGGVELGAVAIETQETEG